MSKFLKIINLETVDSTNAYAFKLADQGVKEITVVSARGQIEGKGRFNRAWHSPKDKGIYISFLLRPKNNLADIANLPVLLSLGVAHAIKNIVTPKIKLPNDILVNGKKICGVLVEAKTFGEKVEFVVTGIGLNVNSTKEQIPDTATSLFLETYEKYDIEKFKNKLIKEVLAIYKEFKRGNIAGLLEEAKKFIS